MITVSKAAAEQILDSAKQGDSTGLKLRLAGTQKENGSIEYVMGFEDRDLDDDIYFDSEGVKIVVSAGCFELLKGTELDYVKLDDNEEMQFIFKNPNDPNYKIDESGTEHHF
jgi:iron-sulfur cluster assembly accessory protein